jgi:hypothetical protein
MWLWYFTRAVGAGVQLRITRAQKQHTIGDGQPFDVIVGDVQASMGARLRFWLRGTSWGAVVLQKMLG